MSSSPSKILEVFDNPNVEIDFLGAMNQRFLGLKVVFNVRVGVFTNVD
tara:strand:- start:279 stop:422 length:144 start_codon:yes stop_codon:yes gene_type:complete